jgi:hypothetical protein
MNGNGMEIFKERGLSLLLAMLMAGMLHSCEDLLSDQEGGDPRDKLVDTWKVDESPANLKSAGNYNPDVEEAASSAYKSGLEVYWVEIEKHIYDTSKIVIYNFYNVDAAAEADLSGNTLSLARQTLRGGFTVSGSGQVQGSKANQIIWTYTVDDGSGQEERLTAVYTRLTL